jgi:sialate O-acetylesterase
MTSPMRLLIAAALLGPGGLRADLQCPSVIGDHMVLQRDTEVPIWGTGDPDEKVTVEFGGQTRSTVVAPNGRWDVRLSPMASEATPRTLLVRGRNTLSFADILVGEVWLCSGQSNMEKPLGPREGQKPTNDYQAAIRAADHPQLRLYQTPRFAVPDPKWTGLCWVRCSPQTVAATNFSAAAYYFGCEIQRALDLPVGLIDTSAGGTRIEEWTPPEAFAREASLARFSGAARSASLEEGIRISLLYDLMIEPFVPFALRGVIWYQGESNVLNGQASLYTDEMRALVGGWRRAWGRPDLPFYYVELAPFRYTTIPVKHKPLTDQELPAFWEAQARALSIPRTGMVVTTDLASDVEDIHPTNKRDVGLRLARLALADTYGRPGPLALSPSFRSMTHLADGTLRLRFRDTGGRLASSDGKPLTDFTLAGTNRVFFPAEATLSGDTVVVRSPQVTRPEAVRFAWSEVATPNLTGAGGLPAMPFRTDDWPLPVPPSTP